VEERVPQAKVAQYFFKKIFVCSALFFTIYIILRALEFFKIAPKAFIVNLFLL